MIYHLTSIDVISYNNVLQGSDKIKRLK